MLSDCASPGRFDQMFLSVLEQLQPVCVAEQKFLTSFFHFQKPSTEEQSSQVSTATWAPASGLSALYHAYHRERENKRERIGKMWIFHSGGHSHSCYGTFIVSVAVCKACCHSCFRPCSLNSRASSSMQRSWTTSESLPSPNAGLNDVMCVSLYTATPSTC